MPRWPLARLHDTGSLFWQMAFRWLPLVVPTKGEASLTSHAHTEMDRHVVVVSPASGGVLDGQALSRWYCIVGRRSALFPSLLLWACWAWGHAHVPSSLLKAALLGHSIERGPGAQWRGRAKAKHGEAMPDQILFVLSMPVMSHTSVRTEPNRTRARRRGGHSIEYRMERKIARDITI